jgi:hypothetical protein
MRLLYAPFTQALCAGLVIAFLIGTLAAWMTP